MKKMRTKCYFFLNQKNVIVKHIKSYIPRERYQADIVLIPNNV